MFISNRAVPIVCVFMCWFCRRRLCCRFVHVLFFASVWLTSTWAVVLQFGFQASFISYTGVTAFLIFQTNGHVSIAACQFWFYDSFIIKCVRLQCSATDGLLHFSHGQGMSILFVCGGEWRRRGWTCACTCVCMFLSLHGWLSVISSSCQSRCELAQNTTVLVRLHEICMSKSPS